MDNTKKERFVDGVEKIHFLGGVVRIDFATFQPNPENPDQPSMETKERLIMTPEGFLRTYNSIQQLAEQLLKQGVLKKNENLQPSTPQSQAKIS
ncbi:MAG: hypothetical protein A2017_15990 [Lentisphaerae bacterium GWF2_44_16]|nr:MAG: hypothetical protein A2017_15990 [Lentisphaerae bacterium GWF2_44_16]